MSKELGESLYIRVIKQALKFPQGFKYSDVINSAELNLVPWEKEIVSRHFKDACERYNTGENTKGQTIFLFIIGNYRDYTSDENKYLLMFEAEFSYIDYQELRFARENAKQARSLSLIAMVLSVFAIIVSAIVPFLIANYMTQNVTIDESQLEEIKK